MFHYLTRADAGTSILVVANARSEDVDETHPLRLLMGGLQAIDRATEIALSGLTKDDTERLASDYQLARDTQVLPIFEFTTQLATLEPPPPEMQQLLGAVHGNQSAMNGFVRVTAGTLSPVDFFDPTNIGKIMQSRNAGAVLAG